MVDSGVAMRSGKFRGFFYIYIVLSCEYPVNSRIEYLFNGALWVGAIVGRDTLVSVAAEGWFGIKELFPEAGATGAIVAHPIRYGRAGG